jgi:hypothetical protein
MPYVFRRPDFPQNRASLPSPQRYRKNHLRFELSRLRRNPKSLSFTWSFT